MVTSGLIRARGGEAEIQATRLEIAAGDVTVGFIQIPTIYAAATRTPVELCHSEDRAMKRAVHGHIATHNAANIVSWVAYTYPINLCGFPAASIPCGFTQAGPPVGLHIVAKALGETDILRGGGGLRDCAAVGRQETATKKGGGGGCKGRPGDG